MADVLIVEDEELLLQTLRYNLSRAGHDVRLCTDGLAALEMIRDDPPDLLLLDLMLPGLDGLEICRRVRQEVGNPAVSQVPILILTARDEEIDNVVGLEVGADDYLTKPFLMHELTSGCKQTSGGLARSSATCWPMRSSSRHQVAGSRSARSEWDRWWSYGSRTPALA